jgi:hypothetical protein
MSESASPMPEPDIRSPSLADTIRAPTLAEPAPASGPPSRMPTEGDEKGGGPEQELINVKHVEEDAKEELPYWQQKSTLEHAGFFSVMLMLFIGDLLKRGSKKPLQMEDLDPLPSPDYPEKLDWVLEGYDEKKDGLIVWRLRKAFFKRWVISSTCHCFWIVCTVASPYVVRNLVDFYVDPEEPLWKGLFLAGLLTFLVVLQTLFINHRFYQLYRMGSNSRAVVMSAVYAKSLRLSSTSRQSSTTGETGKIWFLLSIRLTFAFSQPSVE